MVPWGTVLPVDGIGGMVIVGIVAAPAAFAVLGLATGSGAGATAVVLGGGMTGDGVLSCDSCVDSPEEELTEAGG